MIQQAVLITCSNKLTEFCRNALADCILRVCTSANECICLVKAHKIQLILFDINVLNAGGIGTIDVLANGATDIPVVMLSPSESIFFAANIVHPGIVAILSLPRAVASFRSHIEAAQTCFFQNRPLPVAAETVGITETPLFGFSEKMAELQSSINTYAHTCFSVLLLGESGTGKTYIARYIHEKSPRRQKKFLPLNCASIPDSIAESELFGTVSGAFTGAVSRAGFFEQCNGGTLFLDEVGDLSLAAQAILLQVLENGTFLRVGSCMEQTCDVRLLFATNTDLEDLVRRQRFRLDLYYRISDITLHLPPLRERKEDIPLFVNLFLPETKKITQSALKKLQAHSWPGNIRELRNCIRNAAILSRSQYIDEDAVKFRPPVGFTYAPVPEQNRCAGCPRISDLYT